MMFIDKTAKPTALACSVLFLVMICGCERDMSIRLDGKNPPTFNLAGSGNLVFLYIAEVRGNQRPAVDDPNLWQIRPVEDNKISSLPSITYGIVPNGFKQTTPASGNPPSLIEGKVYEVGGPGFNANGGSIWFTIRDGKSVEVPKPK